MFKTSILQSNVTSLLFLSFVKKTTKMSWWEQKQLENMFHADDLSNTLCLCNKKHLWVFMKMATAEA